MGLNITDIRGLSLKQPWLSWIMLGEKTIETRYWETKFRGTLLLCASQKPHTLGDVYSIAGNDNYERMKSLRNQLGVTAQLPKGVFSWDGCAVGLADLTDITPMNPADSTDAMVAYDPALFCWHLQNVRWINPFMMKGQLKDFRLKQEDFDQIRLAE